MKLIIFDLDGTLCYTINDVVNCIKITINKLKLNEVEESAISNLMGKPIADIFKILFPNSKEEEIKEMCNIYNQSYFENPYSKTELYEGIFDTIDSLKKQGYLLAVATNKNEKVATKIIKHFFPKKFDLIVGNNGKIPLKPNRGMIDYICNKLKCDIKNTIYVGDTEIDYLTAKNNCVKPVIVSYGYRKKDDLKKMISDYFVCVDSSSDLFITLIGL